MCGDATKTPQLWQIRHVSLPHLLVLMGFLRNIESKKQFKNENRAYETYKIVARAGCCAGHFAGGW
ncbi:hypothetical protein Z949_2581 [Sulfitobacter guttiformis KCTC 32187]|nr:hypothetical protein Z949_2581 [Sulfitobacter guttiformis KCTC 32187]